MPGTYWRIAGLVGGLAAMAVGAAAADDLSAQARALLAGGLAPEKAAVRLMQQGSDAEDAAAALFEIVPDQTAERRVAFAVMRAGIAADPEGAVPLAAEIAGLAQPAPVPVAAALAVAAPQKAAAAARVIAGAAPQAAPLIAAAIIRLAPQTAADVAAAVAEAVPSQALFTAAAALQTAPAAAREPIIDAVTRVTGIEAQALRGQDAVRDAVGANAMREAEEVLADLPLAETRQ